MVSLKDRELAKKKRYSLAGTPEALELAQARAGKKGLTAVETPEGTQEKTKEQIQAEEAAKLTEAKKQLETQKAEELANTPESIALALKQQQEIQNIDLLKSNAPQPSVAQRNVQAGMAAVNAISQTFGGEAKSLEEQQANIEQFGAAAVPAKILLTTLGKATSTKVVGFSISDLFSKSNQGNIKNLQGDASDMLAEAKRITTAATSKGSDVQQAINSLNLIEEGILSRYADAEIALSASPADIAEGLDLTEDLSFSLRAVTEQRQALERYQLTGDVNQVLALGNLMENSEL